MFITAQDFATDPSRVTTYLSHALGVVVEVVVQGSKLNVVSNEVCIDLSARVHALFGDRISLLETGHDSNLGTFVTFELWGQ
jgi:hypothetical protein